MKRELLINNNKEVIDYQAQPNGDVKITVDGQVFHFSDLGQSGEMAWLKSKGSFKTAWGFKDDLAIEGIDYKVIDLKTSKRVKGSGSDEGGMLSPMPGKVLKVLIKAGDSVKKGDSLIVMEAMKMEHTIKASEDGVIDQVLCEQGSLVDGGVPLCSMKEAE